MDSGSSSNKANIAAAEVMNVEENRTEISNEIEQQKLALLRTNVEKQDPTSKDVDDLMLRRFLRARNLDIEKASCLFLKYLKWRREFVPKGFISDSEVSNNIQDKKFFAQGISKEGCPIGVMFGRKHFPNKAKGGLDELKRFVVYFIDKLCSRMSSGQEKFMVIVDLQGWGYANCDIRAYLGGLAILQDCYPERLGKLLLVNVPYVFMTAWKMIYPLIDSNTRKKIVFVAKGKLTSTLLQDIDESQLPDIYGGKLPLVSIEDN